MIETPADPTCVVKSGEEVVILSGDVFKLPNGATTATLENCKFESGAIISFNYTETEDKPKHKASPARHHEAEPPAYAPEETTAATIEETITSTIEETKAIIAEPKIEIKKNKKKTNISILAILAAALTGIAVLFTSGQPKAISSHQREQERKRCHGNADRIKSAIADAVEIAKNTKIIEVKTPDALYGKIEATIAEVSTLTKLVRKRT